MVAPKNKKLITENLILTTAPFIVFQVNEEGYILAVNPAIRDILGYFEGEIDNTSIYKLFPRLLTLEYTSFDSQEVRGELELLDDDDTDEIKDDVSCLNNIPASPLERFINGHVAILENKKEHLLTAKSGLDIWLNLEISKAQIQDHYIYIITAQDITSKKLSEKEVIDLNMELLELNASLEEKVIARTEELNRSNNLLTTTLNQLKSAQKKVVLAQKMSSLGNIVKGVAHEINTPLGIVLSSVTTIEQSVKTISDSFNEKKLSPTQLKKFIDFSEECLLIATKNLNSVANLVNNFKELAVDDQNEPNKNINLVKLLRKISDKYNDESNLDIELHIEKEISISSKAILLSHVISQILSNIELHAYSKDEINKKVRIKLELNDERVLVNIKDFGYGIEDDKQEKIFDPFYTTGRGSRKLLGLGLSIAYNTVVQNLQGNLFCSSELNEGATFSLSLPLSIN